MDKKRRNILVLVAIAVIVGATLWANLGIDRKDRTEVDVDRVERGTIVAKVSGPGRVRAVTTVQISSSLMGRITELGVDEGDMVERGDFLLRLEDVWYVSQVEQSRAQVDRARAELATAERELSDLTEQYRLDLASEKDLHDAQRMVEALTKSLESAKASLRAAEDQLDKTVFHSPIDGVVTRLNVEEGENVVTGTMNAPGTVIMTISDLPNMEVEAEIDETDIVDVRVGQPAEIEVEALADTLLPGTVTEVGNSGVTSMAGTQEEVTNFLVTVRVDRPHQALKPGMTATVEITTAVHEDVLNVPIQAVALRKPSELERSEDEDEAEEPRRLRSDRDDEEEEIEGVFVVEDEEARFVPVATGIADELSIEVEGELEDGQLVVSGPYRELRELRNGDALEYDEDEVTTEGGNIDAEDAPDEATE
ncbi:MAG: efflux RND transporter periplasmic adaptor subunit [Candidatus Eisenbacteria bacterium]|nr:efflux RND transporter periplasmic adaptor subunit [Candidatus Eisenbacteria bacterium]